jgi:monovalent cation/hydrogen antiporter
MLETVAVGLAGLAAVVMADMAARRIGVPNSILLVVVGLVYGFLPGPNLQLKPDLVLVAVIPPLLYAAALNSSLVALRGSARAVGGLSVGLVLLTAIAVGAGVSTVTAAVPLAAGIALGAAVSPPDPVAALSIGRRAGLPSRLITLVEGEGLLNDATALTILKVAVAAAAAGSFSLAHAVSQFVLAAAGGVIAGLIVALVVGRVRAMGSEPLVDNALSLATPFAAYLLAEAVHVSGVLAVVVAGLWVGHRNAYLQSSQSRLQSSAVWRLVEFLLEGYVFLLIGQQLPSILQGLRPYSTTTVAATAAVTAGLVLVVRPLWLVTVSRLPGWLHARLGGDPQLGNRPLTGKELLALSWAGTRGVITLAAAFSLPTGFPARDLLLFCAYLVVLVTLLGQGLTFAPLLRRLALPGAEVNEALLRNQARVAAANAALRRLAQLRDSDPQLTDIVSPLQQSMQTRLRRYSDRVALLTSTEDDVLPVDDRYHAAVRARREMIEAERDELVNWRDSGRLPDASLRILQRELDHQESVLPAPPST